MRNFGLEFKPVPDGPVPDGLGTRALLVIVTLALAWVMIPDQVEAQSRTCMRLERQLASLSKTSRSSNPLRVLRYNNAIRRQKDQMKQGNRRLRRAGCSGSRRGAASCRRLTGSLRKMEINLKQLRAKRSRLSGKSGSTRAQRRKVRRALAANNCNRLRPVIANNRSGVIIERRSRRSIIEQVFGDERRQSRRRPKRKEVSKPDTRVSRSSTFRTLCVRGCDGYYFPISYSTTKDNFDRDVQACQAKCPGTTTELYYHMARGESSENMISYRTQEPYTNSENAFKYRQIVTKGCGCNFTKGRIASIAGDGGTSLDNNGILSREPVIGTPIFRIDRSEDPETLANLKGGFVPSVVAPGKPADAKTRAKRKVRVVGEAFFPAQ